MHRLVGRADDLARIDDLLDAVRAPARDARAGEDRRVELHRQIEHTVDEAAVKVDVCGNALVDAAFLADDLRREPRHAHIQPVFVAASFFFGEPLGKALHDFRARVGDRVHRVPHAVDQTRLVEGILIEQAREVAADFILVRPILDLLLHVLKHPHNLDVCAAVLRPLERAERRRDGRIRVRAGGGDDVRRERRVVAAAVLRVEHQRDVEHLRLKRREFLVRAQNAQNVFGGRQLGLWLVNVQAVPVVVVAVRLIAVDREQRENRDELDALAQHVRHRDVVRRVIVGIHRQHAARERVHHVAAGRLHDDVAHEVCRQRPVKGKLAFEQLELFGRRQLAEKQQIGRHLKSEAVVGGHAAHEILDVIAAVKKLTLARDACSVHDFMRTNFRNVGQTCQHAVAVEIAQTALYVVLAVECGVDHTVLCTIRGKLQNLRRDFRIDGSGHS